MKLGSPRAETKASLLPSGHQRGLRFRPRATSCCGFSDPSSGASQIWPSLTKEMVPREETSGELPASTRLGSPLVQVTVQTACSAPAGLLVGLGTCPAAFFPPPRT